MSLDETTASFRARIEPYVGKHVAVWKTTLYQPYRAGELLRVSDDGLVIAGHGVVAYPEIGTVDVDGVVIPFVEVTP
jgi:hypothetical protein